MLIVLSKYLCLCAAREKENLVHAIWRLLHANTLLLIFCYREAYVWFQLFCLKPINNFIVVIIPWACFANSCGHVQWMFPMVVYLHVVAFWCSGEFTCLFRLLRRFFRFPRKHITACHPWPFRQGNFEAEYRLIFTWKFVVNYFP